MNVRSPKNGFVIKLFVDDNENVKASSPLLEMDSDSEDRYSDHLDILEGMRAVRAAQYFGAELELMQSIAKIAVDTSAARLDWAGKGRLYGETLYFKGLLSAPDWYNFETAFQQATWEHERAKSQQQRLEFAVSRHNQLNDLAKRWNERQKAFVAERKSRLRIGAPVSGKVRLLVREGSFAKYGNIIAEMK